MFNQNKSIDESSEKIKMPPFPKRVVHFREKVYDRRYILCALMAFLILFLILTFFWPGFLLSVIAMLIAILGILIF